jgi:hypothetical protein
MTGREREERFTEGVNVGYAKAMKTVSKLISMNLSLREIVEAIDAKIKARKLSISKDD